MSTALALMFSRNGLDDETEIAEFRQRLRASPDGTLRPIPGLRITVREADIAGLSPRETRLYLFRQLAEPLYRGGPEAMAALADDPEMQKAIAGGVGLLGLFSAQTHQTLQRGLTVLMIVALVLLPFLILFSYRFGRLGSPGCVLFVVSLPGALILTFLARAVQPMTTPPAGEEAGLTGMVGYLASNLLPVLVAPMARNYLIALGIGFGLMLLAVLGSLVWRLVRKP
jgi:hypothetical protein